MSQQCPNYASTDTELPKDFLLVFFPIVWLGLVLDLCSFNLVNFSGWWSITLHSTITWLTSTCFLDGSAWQIKILILTITQTLILTRNLAYFLIWPRHVISRDQSSFAQNLSGKHFNPTLCGVIRNQHSKIHRSNITTTAWGLLRKILKFECRMDLARSNFSGFWIKVKARYLLSVPT